MKKVHQFSYDHVVKGVNLILYGLDVDKSNENFLDTPKRVAKGLKEICRGLYEKEAVVENFTKAVFKSKNDEMVVMKDIDCYGMCPHHLLPVEVTASIAYVPNGKVVGLSKLVRLTEIIFAQPVLQEDATVEIADLLMKKLDAQGSAVHISGKHLCMACRGVKKTNAVTVTSAVRGCFKNDGKTRDEFFSLVRG